MTARVLVFSTLYPNALQPNHGIFVETRLRHTLAQGGLAASVLAPRPWFPFSHPVFGHYAIFAQIPPRGMRHDIEVAHPPYPVFPKLSLLTPWLLYRASLHAIREMQAAGQRFDVIDAHYFYPDGVAAALLGQSLGLPVIITGRGTDLTLIPRNPLAKRQIQWAARQANTLVTVCEDLRQRLLALGVAPDKVVTLRNGIDLDQFTPGPRQPATGHFGLLSVGSLIPRKGHDLVIQALAHMPDCHLTIAGDGPLRDELQNLAHRLGVTKQVHFLGEVPHAQLPQIYRDADMMVLASAREGWANVLLESLACGTPVVATNVNGSPEVVSSPAAGRLTTDRTVGAIRDAIATLRSAPPSREAARRHAMRFSWTETARANRDLLQAAARAGHGVHAGSAADAARASLEACAGTSRLG